jgi:hypothetical protein
LSAACVLSWGLTKQCSNEKISASLPCICPVNVGHGRNYVVEVTVKLSLSSSQVACSGCCVRVLLMACTPLERCRAMASAVTQDLHLAKRFYDRAVAAAPDAWLPVRCALAGLSAHAAWLRLAPRLPRQLAWLRRHVFAAPTQPGAASQIIQCSHANHWLASAPGIALDRVE